MSDALIYVVRQADQDLYDELPDNWRNKLIAAATLRSFELRRFLMVVKEYPQGYYQNSCELPKLKIKTKVRH